MRFEGFEGCFFRRSRFTFCFLIDISKIKLTFFMIRNIYPTFINIDNIFKDNGGLFIVFFIIFLGPSFPQSGNFYQDFFVSTFYQKPS